MNWGRAGQSAQMVTGDDEFSVVHNHIRHIPLGLRDAHVCAARGGSGAYTARATGECRWVITLGTHNS